MKKLKQKTDSKRYYLHNKIKTEEPEDYKLLNTKKREFTEKPVGKFSNKLLNKFQYNIQLKLL